MRDWSEEIGVGCPGSGGVGGGKWLVVCGCRPTIQIVAADSDHKEVCCAWLLDVLSQCVVDNTLH